MATQHFEEMPLAPKTQKGIKIEVQEYKWNLHKVTKFIQKGKQLLLTWDILPNREDDAVLRRWGVKLAAPLALRVRWSSINKVDVLDNQ